MLLNHCDQARLNIHIALRDIALKDDRQVIANRPLDTVCGAIDDPVAQPHRAGASAVEVDRRADAQSVGHE